MSGYYANMAVTYAIKNNDADFILSIPDKVISPIMEGRPQNKKELNYYWADYDLISDVRDYYYKYNVLPTIRSVQMSHEDFTPTLYEDIEPKDVILEKLQWEQSDRIMVATIQGLREANLFGKRMLERTEKACERAREVTTPLIKTNLVDDIMTAYEERENGASYYPTGITELDNIFIGWDKQSEYAVMAARPGTGKSMILCISAAQALRQGLRVVYYTGEMPASSIAERLICNYSVGDKNFTLRNIKGGTLDNKAEYKKYIEEKFPLDRLYIATKTQDFNGDFPTAEQLEVVCRKHNADILFIDQLTCMRDRDNATILYEVYSNISRQIKLIRDRLNIPVIAAHQLKADSTGLSKSDTIFQDATKCITFAVDESDPSILNANIIKMRDFNIEGKTSFNLYKDFDHARFKESREENKNVYSSEYRDNGQNVFSENSRPNFPTK